MSYLAAVIPTMRETIDSQFTLQSKLTPFCDRVINADADMGIGEWKMDYRLMLIEACRPGLHGAYMSAWDWIDKDWYIGHIDAGGSHDPLDLCDMYDLASTMDYDVVLGDRFGIGGEHHGKWSRRVTSRLASWALNLISFAQYDDWTSGLRVYSPKARAVLEKHKFTTTGHAWQIESLWVLREAGMKIAEYPIVYQPSVSHLSASRVREAGSLWWRLLWA